MGACSLVPVYQLNNFSSCQVSNHQGDMCVFIKAITNGCLFEHRVGHSGHARKIIRMRQSCCSGECVEKYVSTPPWCKRIGSIAITNSRLTSMLSNPANVHVVPVSLVNHKRCKISRIFERCENCSGRILCNSCNTITERMPEDLQESSCIYTMIQWPAEAARTSPFFPAAMSVKYRTEPEPGSIADQVRHWLHISSPCCGKTSADEQVAGMVRCHGINITIVGNRKPGCVSTHWFREIVSTSCKKNPEP